MFVLQNINCVKEKCRVREVLLFKHAHAHTHTHTHTHAHTHTHTTKIIKI